MNLSLRSSRFNHVARALCIWRTECSREILSISHKAVKLRRSTQTRVGERPPYIDASLRPGFLRVHDVADLGVFFLFSPSHRRMSRTCRNCRGFFTKSPRSAATGHRFGSNSADGPTWSLPSVIAARTVQTRAVITLAHLISSPRSRLEFFFCSLSFEGRA